jgi:hypothetical protein
MLESVEDQRSCDEKHAKSLLEGKVVTVVLECGEGVLPKAIDKYITHLGASLEVHTCLSKVTRREGIVIVCPSPAKEEGKDFALHVAVDKVMSLLEENEKLLSMLLVPLPQQAELSPYKNLNRLWFAVRPLRYHDLCSTIINMMGSHSGVIEQVASVDTKAAPGSQQRLRVLLIARPGKERTAIRARLLSSGYHIILLDDESCAVSHMEQHQCRAVVICSHSGTSGPEVCDNIRCDFATFIICMKIMSRCDVRDQVHIRGGGHISANLFLDPNP